MYEWLCMLACACSGTCFKLSLAFIQVSLHPSCRFASCCVYVVDVESSLFILAAYVCFSVLMFALLISAGCSVRRSLALS